MIPSKCCFTKSDIKNWFYLSEVSLNQAEYPWFSKSKCTLNFGLEKSMLTNSADMSHLPPFRHLSSSPFGTY